MTREQMEARAREYRLDNLGKFCPDCDHGVVNGEPCKSCKGTGYESITWTDGKVAAFALREIEAQDRQEATQCDRHWLSGLRYGWNMGQLNDRAAYIEAQECREREIRASHPNPSPPEEK